jgi:hypothetical protein
MTTDFFSASFLFSVLVIMLVTGIFVYVNYKMSEQDHKLSSMVSLVSMLAQDLQYIKNKVNVTQTHVEPNSLQYQSQMIGGENEFRLIDVSDGEDNDEDNDEENDDNEEDDEEDDEYGEDDYEEDEYEEDDDHENSNKHIQLLNLTLVNNDVDNDLNNDLHIEEINIHDSSSNMDDIKTIHIEDTIDVIEKLTEVKESDTNNNHDINSEELTFLKNVSITDLGDIQDLHESKTEYKKMSLNKLREVVVSKGVISDASKLKKHDILKMLGDE